MGDAALGELMLHLRSLYGGDAEQALLQLAREIGAERTAALIEQARLPQLRCPRCAHNGFYRHGKANNLQRYRCQRCGRTFNCLTNTPLARLRLKDRWPAYFDSLRDPACTVHRAADQVGVHANTSFRWRHRMLDWVKYDRPRTLQGIVEVDETFLLESEKGNKQLVRRARKRGGVARRRGISAEQVNIVVARDRAGATVDFVAGRGALKVASLDTHLLPKLERELERDTLLVTDGNPVYARFARKARIAHSCVNVSEGVRVKGPIHVQNVNAYHSRFKAWLRHFHGVATRYLNNYLGWRWAIDMKRIDDATRFLRAALGVFTT